MKENLPPVSGIRRSLLVSFLTGIMILVMPVVYLGIFFGYQKAQYQLTMGTMLHGYEIVEKADQHVELYTQTMLERDKEDSLERHTSLEEQTMSLVKELKPVIMSEEGRSALNRVEGTLSVLHENTRKGIESVRARNFSESTETLNQIKRANEKVRSEVTDLILAELEYATEMQQATQARERTGLFVGAALFGASLLGYGFLSVVYSKKMSEPLVALSGLAESVAEGNMSLNVWQDIMERKDEIGSLARSFDKMLGKLRGSITEISKSKVELEKRNVELSKTKEEIEKSNVELSRFNKLVVNRELKMVELKKEIEILKANQKVE